MFVLNYSIWCCDLLNCALNQLVQPTNGSQGWGTLALLSFFFFLFKSRKNMIKIDVVLLCFFCSLSRSALWFLPWCAASLCWWRWFSQLWTFGVKMKTGSRRRTVARTAGESSRATDTRAAVCTTSGPDWYIGLPILSAKIGLSQIYCNWHMCSPICTDIKTVL